VGGPRPPPPPPPHYTPVRLVHFSSKERVHAVEFLKKRGLGNVLPSSVSDPYRIFWIRIRIRIQRFRRKTDPDPDQGF
jgi:hypothetical protein